MTYLAQFFTYIPILEYVLSFETRKLHKWLNSKIVDFCVEVDQKSKFSSQTCLAQFFRDLEITNLIHISEVLAVSKTQAPEIKV